MRRKLWRKWAVCVLAVCLLAASVANVAAQPVRAAAVPLFFEDFESGQADYRFQLGAGSGPYEVAEADGSHVYRTNFNGIQYAYFNADNLPEDYSVEAKVRLNGWGASTPSNVGLFLKYSNNEEYYSVSYEKSSNGTAGSRFNIRKRYHGTTTYLAAQSKTTVFSLNTDYILKGEISGGTIKLYVNGELLLEAEDPEPLAGGFPGLYALRVNADFDDFAVYGGGAPEEPPQAPSGLVSTGITSTTVDLQWNAPPGGADGYRIYSGGMSLPNVTPAVADAVNQTVAAQVYGLQPGTVYSFAVRAIAGGILSGFSEEYTVATSPAGGSAAIPYEIANVRASLSDSNVPENAVDSDLTTRWSAFGDGQWIELDLGQTRSIGYLGIAFYRGDTRSKQLEIELSEDGVEWKPVYQGVSGGKTALLEAFGWSQPAPARYVRVIGRGADAWTSISEIQVYAPHPDGFVLGELVAPPAGPDPEAPLPTKAGLFYADGTPHTPHVPLPVTGRTLNVADFGANPEDNGADDAPAIRAAIAEAKAGDEVYFPNGHYQLTSTTSDNVSHLYIHSGIQLRGESQDGVLLVSDHANEAGEYATSEGITIRVAGQHDIRISSMTITASWDAGYSSNTSVANPLRGGPKQAIYITGSRGVPSYNITVDHVTVEKFQRMGVAIIYSHDVVVEHSLFRNATDIAEGGSGYGVSIESKPKESRLGRSDDTYFNVVRNNTFIGPYVRHGTILQFYAHNNLIENNYYENIALDALDFHGEDEYMNEARFNHFVGGGEAAVGVGNSGASHDAAGPGNYIHDNLIENVGRYGVQVYLGSPDTVIENNTIRQFTKPGSQGIRLKNATGTVVRGNTIENNPAEGFWGVAVMYDAGDPSANGNGSGAPEHILIVNNRITGNSNGVEISAGTDITLANNEISGNTGVDYVNHAAVPQQLAPWETAVAAQQQESSPPGILTVRGEQDGNGRQAYFKFDLRPLSGSIATAWLNVYGSVQEGEASVVHSLYAVDDDQWEGPGLGWSGKPQLGGRLTSAPVGGGGQSSWHRFDATLYVKEQALADGAVSLALAQEQAQPGLLAQFDGAGEHQPYLQVELYPPVELAEVVVKADKMQLLEGEAVSLQARGKLNTGTEVELGAAPLTFQSLTPRLAAVTEAGVVTALRKGEAVIQATAVWNGHSVSGTITLQISDNLALGALLTVDSTSGSNAKERMLDGNLSTRWISAAASPDGQLHYVRLEWTLPQRINHLKLWSGHDPVAGSPGWHVRDFDLEYWDGSEWQTAAQVRDNPHDAYKQEFTRLDVAELSTTAIQLKFIRPSWGAGNANDSIVRINELFVGLADHTPPGDVADGRMVAGDGRLTLSWTDPADEDLDHIRISAEPQNEAGEWIVEKGRQTAVIESLTNGVTYTFRITAVDESGNEAAGVALSGTPVAAENPGGGEAEEQPGSGGNQQEEEQPEGGEEEAAGQPGAAGGESGNGVTVAGGRIYAAGTKADPVAGQVKVEIAAAAVEAAISQDRAQNGGAKARLVVEAAAASGAESYLLVLPAAALSAAGADADIVWKTELAAWTLPAHALLHSAGPAAGEIGLAAIRRETGALPDSLRQLLAGKPLLELRAYADGRELAFAPGKVAIPYAPSAAELQHAEHLTAWQVDALGRVQPVTDGRYDAASGTIVFSSSKPGIFAAAFVQENFTDLGAYPWAGREIEVMAAKGIVKGYGDGHYKPESRITRAEFAAMLARLLKLEALGGGQPDFADVRPEDWFYNDIAMALQAGLIDGREDGRFAPGEPVTRQDMAVMIDRALAAMSATAPEESAGGDSRFEDYGRIGSYAQAAVLRAAQYGLMQGTGEGLFAPEAYGTRAEAAVVLYRLYNMK